MTGARVRFKRRDDSVLAVDSPLGLWGGVIGFQCPWAHPVWSEYLLLVYDLDSPAISGKLSIKYDPAATHELVLHAVNPSTKIDFRKSLFTQQDSVGRLTPANHGYQFKAENNDAAWKRVRTLVDACFNFELSPDSDFSRDWDSRMIDGWSLRK